VRKRSNITWRLGGRWGGCATQTARVSSNMEGWPNRHITFIVAKKLNLQFILLYLRYMGEEVGWKCHMREGVGCKTSEYSHMEGGCLKLLKKYIYHMVFERSLKAQYSAKVKYSNIDPSFHSITTSQHQSYVLNRYDN